MLLFGRKYWERVIDFAALVDEGVIEPDDLEIFSYVETAEEAWKLLEPVLSATCKRHRAAPSAGPPRALRRRSGAGRAGRPGALCYACYSEMDTLDDPRSHRLRAYARLPHGPTMNTTALEIIGVVLLVVFNAFFVVAEFAIVKVRDTRMAELAAAGKRRARVADHIVNHLDAYLSATQLGVTVASLGLGWLGASAFTRVFDMAINQDRGRHRRLCLRDLHHHRSSASWCPSRSPSARLSVRPCSSRCRSAGSM